MIAPTVFPDDPRKVTYVYKREVSLRSDNATRRAIGEHAERYGRDSVIFKGRTPCLARGKGCNERNDRGPNITSLNRADRCALRLPVVGSWLLQAPFSLKDLTGFGKMTFVDIYKGYSYNGITYIEVNWAHEV